MKIVHLISSGGFYGAERVMVDLAAYTRDQGHRVEAWVLESPGAGAVMAALQERGVTARHIEPDWRRLAGVCWRVRRYVDEQGIDILHSHGYRTDVVVALAGMGMRVCRIATCHSWCSTSAKLRFYEWLDKKTLRLFDRIAVVSPQLEQSVKAAGIGDEKVRVVLNGTDIPFSGERNGLREEFGIGEEQYLLVRIGRLDHLKGNDILLKAFADGFAGRDAMLLFVGEGERAHDLQRQAERLGVRKQVLFAGYRKDVARFLEASDLFVISSRSEGLPIVLLEAMAAGKPIVTTDVGAIGSVITNGYNGLLVPPQDATALARALRRVADDPLLAVRLAEGAEKSYRHNHTLEAMGRRYLEIYQECMEKG